MGRQALNRELHSEDIAVEQKSDIINEQRQPEIVRAEQLPSNAYIDELKFNEEPVVIRLEAVSEKNAPTHHHCAVNGIGCEVLVNGQWVQMPYIPVGQNLTVKRKYIEVLARAKSDQITTKHDDVGAEYIDNRVVRVTSRTTPFTVIKDSERGHAWMSEILRRNY
jgi:hypothetical protein